MFFSDKINPLAIQSVFEVIACLLVCIFFVNIVVCMLQGKRNTTLISRRLAAILRERGWPPPDNQEVPPRGTGFQLLQLCRTACTKYVLAVYKRWKTNRHNVHTSVGNYDANDWYSIVTCIYSR